MVQLGRRSVSHTGGRTEGRCSRPCRASRTSSCAATSIDLAVGIVIGAAFTALVTAFTTSFIEPLIKHARRGPARPAGAFGRSAARSSDWAAFLNALITFILTAAVLYFLVVLPMNRLAKRRKEGNEPEPEAPSEEVRLLTEIRDALRGADGPATAPRPAQATTAETAAPERGRTVIESAHRDVVVVQGLHAAVVQRLVVRLEGVAAGSRGSAGPCASPRVGPPCVERHRLRLRPSRRSALRTRRITFASGTLPAMWTVNSRLTVSPCCGEISQTGPASGQRVGPGQVAGDVDVPPQVGDPRAVDEQAHAGRR